MFQDLCRQERSWNYLYEIVSLFLKNGKYTSTTFGACLIVNKAVTALFSISRTIWMIQNVTFHANLIRICLSKK